MKVKTIFCVRQHSIIHRGLGDCKIGSKLQKEEDLFMDKLMDFNT